MAAEIAVLAARAELFDELAPLYAELHELQVTVAPEMAGLAPVEADTAWRRRRALYERELPGGTSVLVLARARGATIGYGFASLQHGYSGWGEESTRVGVVHDLVVAASSRGGGVGSALLDHARRALADRGATVLRLNVVAGNASALRFYARHGLRPLTQILGAPLTTA
jgi:GNAT superfamily N-acetyltransferase